MRRLLILALLLLVSCQEPIIPGEGIPRWGRCVVPSAYVIYAENTCIIQGA